MHGKLAEEQVPKSNSKPTGIESQSSSHMRADDHVGGDTARVQSYANSLRDDDAGGSLLVATAAPLLCGYLPVLLPCFVSIFLQNASSCHVCAYIYTNTRTTMYGFLAPNKEKPCHSRCPDCKLTIRWRFRFTFPK
jgi:hypothetical protein